MGQPKVAVFQAKVVSLEWSSQLPHGGCAALALGVAAAYSGGACFSSFLLGLLCSLPLCLALRLKLLPSSSVFLFKSSSEPQGWTVVLLCCGWWWEGRTTPVSHLPPTLLNRNLLFSFSSPAIVSQEGERVSWALSPCHLSQWGCLVAGGRYCGSFVDCLDKAKV